MHRCHHVVKQPCINSENRCAPDVSADVSFAVIYRWLLLDKEEASACHRLRCSWFQEEDSVCCVPCSEGNLFCLHVHNVVRIVPCRMLAFNMMWHLPLALLVLLVDMGSVLRGCSGGIQTVLIVAAAAPGGRRTAQPCPSGLHTCELEGMAQVRVPAMILLPYL